jgi:hypothetical protein
MKKFIINLLFVFVILAFPNLSIGIYRLLISDNTLQFNKNLNDENFIFNYKIKSKRDTLFSNFRKGDISNKISKLDDTLVSIYDEFGFSNLTQNRRPEIVLIGDSYFHDPGNGTEYGFQSKINSYFNKNCSYNIGAVLCSDFRVYNEFYEREIFLKKPKFIILEIIERNFYKWSNIYKDLSVNKIKTSKYKYLGLDLLLANNFQHNSLNNSKQSNDEIKENDDIQLFYKNKVSVYDDELIENVVNELEWVRNYLLNQNIKLLVLVAPDKETLCPNRFGKSSYEQIYEALDQKDIANLNILEFFKNDLSYYYQDDTHWNQKAIDLISVEICRWIDN